MLAITPIDPADAAGTANLRFAVDDVYVFGSGMDYRGYWRGLPGIYAVAGRT